VGVWLVAFLTYPTDEGPMAGRPKRLPADSTTSASARCAEISPQQSFEQEYQKIGWWKGEHASPQAQERIRSFWMNSGRAGAEWLASRLRQETHSDVLDAAGSLLADIGRSAVEPILTELDNPTSQEHAKVLLLALGWMAPEEGAVHAERIESMLRRFMAETRPELREAAAEATAILRASCARCLLSAVLEREPDEEVRGTLEAVLSGRSGE
jgi:hypothetical protein